MEIELNVQQLSAVNATEGPVLVIAGAGSGKTRVLTARICHLIEMGVSPYNILAITFTNKAANEMKERIERYIGSTGVWTSTFHSMCARMLRVDASRIGYTEDFSIYTEQESDRVVRRILADATAVDPKKKNEIMWHISRAKTLGMSPQDYYDAIKDDENDAAAITLVYRRYEDELRRANSLDFDDLLLKTIELFEKCPDVLEKYQRRFTYLHVDEFQDTNGLQYKLVKMLSALSRNIFAVGDEDQSIYSWRGAEIRNILDFPKDYPDAKVIKLERNYRSTSSILKAANNVIKNNSNRNDKTLWSDKQEENCVEYYEAYNDRDEAEKVARTISVLTKEDASYRDIAVLVRANSLTRQFEEEFNLHGIPYRVFGGYRFFERKEIKDALAYVRLALNPSDNDSLLRIINYPKRGIGDGAVNELKEAAANSDSTLFTILINHDKLSSGTSKKLSGFANIMLDIIEKKDNMQPVEFMQYVLRRSGLEDFLNSSKDREDINRLENIEELVAAVRQFLQDNPESSISDFMQSVALVSDTDEMDEDNYVTIATVHAVKGLEFDYVFIIGLEEGIFPTQRAITAGDLEEERRLMYVAITRAKKRLFIFNARSRYRYGKTENFPKSRFVGEMSGVRQSLRYTNSGYNSHGSAAQASERIRLGANNPGSQNFKNNISNFNKTRKGETSVDYDKFVKNTIVEHSKFGRGVIVETSGEGEDKIASILFRKLGVKRFALAIAAPSLKIVDDI